MKRARDEAEFNEHVQRVVVFSLYTADDLPTYGEQVLALSTCDIIVEEIHIDAWS